MNGPLHGEVLELLSGWLPSNSVAERPQIQVATVDSRGRPDIRTVLLSEWDEQGFVFHTDARSRKVEQLATHRGVAIEVLWPAFTRQLVISGLAETADERRVAAGYRRRSPYLQQLAWQNSADLAQSDRRRRLEQWRRFQQEHDIASLPAPTTWTGYLVRADRVTFWESEADGPSHRVEYRLEGSGDWSVHHLPG